MTLGTERSIETGRSWQDLPPEPPEGDPLPAYVGAGPPTPPPVKRSYWPWAVGAVVFLLALAALLAWSPWRVSSDNVADAVTPAPGTSQTDPQSTGGDPQAPQDDTTTPESAGGGGDGTLPDGAPDAQGSTPDALEDLLQGSGLEDLLQGSGLEDLLQGSGLEDLLGDLNPEDLLGGLNPEDLLGGLNPEDLLNGLSEDGAADPFQGLPLPSRDPVEPLFTMGSLPDGITEAGQSLTASGETTRQVVTVSGPDGRITIRGTVGGSADADLSALPGDDVVVDGWDGRLDSTPLRIVVVWVEDGILLELIAPATVGENTVIDIAESVEAA